MIENYKNTNLDHANRVDFVNSGVISFASRFISQPHHLECYLIANPFRKNVILNLNPQTNFSLEIINKIIAQDNYIIANKDKFKAEKAIYFLLLWEYLKKDENQNFISKSRANYLIELLNSISIDKIGSYLYDRFFAISNPNLFSKIQKSIEKSFEEQKEDKKYVENIISSIAFKNNINIKISSRIKSIYSISEKIRKKNLLIDQLNDLVGIRIITENEVCCYRILNQIIIKFDIIHDALKDYIACPKDNGYRSIHASILYNNKPIEIQIRSKDMHLAAEYGTACHNTYKNSDNLTIIQSYIE